jgi:hypothetical protein
MLGDPVFAVSRRPRTQVTKVKGTVLQANSVVAAKESRLQGCREVQAAGSCTWPFRFVALKAFYSGSSVAVNQCSLAVLLPESPVAL